MANSIRDELLWGVEEYVKTLKRVREENPTEVDTLTDRLLNHIHECFRDAPKKDLKYGCCSIILIPVDNGYSIMRSYDPYPYTYRIDEKTSEKIRESAEYYLLCALQKEFEVKYIVPQFDSASEILLGVIDSLMEEDEEKDRDEELKWYNRFIQPHWKISFIPPKD